MLIRQTAELDNLSSEIQPTKTDDIWNNPWIWAIISIALIVLIILGIRMLLTKSKN